MKQMNQLLNIPVSTATRYLIFSLIAGSIAIPLILLDAPVWLCVIPSAISLGLLLVSIYCVLDIQEYKMRLEQQILNVLKEIKDSDNVKKILSKNNAC